MNKRELCLEYLVKNYLTWPVEYDSPGAVSHHGYSWRKIDPRGEWILVNQFGDTLTLADHLRAYESSVKMSEMFDMAEYAGEPYPDVNGFVQLAFSPEQYRAMCLAVRQHDGLKAKIKQVRFNARRLYGELGEDHG